MVDSGLAARQPAASPLVGLVDGLNCFQLKFVLRNSGSPWPRARAFASFTLRLLPQLPSCIPGGDATVNAASSRLRACKMPILLAQHVVVRSMGRVCDEPDFVFCMDGFGLVLVIGCRLCGPKHAAWQPSCVLFVVVFRTIIFVLKHSVAYLVHVYPS